MNGDMFGAINQAIKAYGKMQKSGYGNSFLNPYNNYNQMNINNNPYFGLGNGGYLTPYNNQMNYQNPQFFNNNIGVNPIGNQMNNQYNRFNNNGYYLNNQNNVNGGSVIRTTNNLYLDRIKNFLNRPV